MLRPIVDLGSAGAGAGAWCWCLALMLVALDAVVEGAAPAAPHLPTVAIGLQTAARTSNQQPATAAAGSESAVDRHIKQKPRRLAAPGESDSSRDRSALRRRIAVTSNP
jgi:hypothetical protein